MSMRPSERQPDQIRSIGLTRNFTCLLYTSDAADE